jgi:hypothetical protein
MSEREKSNDGVTKETAAAIEALYIDFPSADNRPGSSDSEPPLFGRASNRRAGPPRLFVSKLEAL